MKCYIMSSDTSPLHLTNRQRIFVEEYLICWNATEAARRANYKHPNKQGPALLVNLGIQGLIEQRISEKAMSADEVLIRLADMARSDMGDFLDISGMGFNIDLAKAKELGLTKLIKKVKQRTTITSDRDGNEEENHWIEFEIYDAQAALDKLARHHSLYNDNIDITSGGEIIRVTLLGKDD